MLELLLAAQINCLAEAVFAESRGENRAGQLYVAATVKNRVLDERFSNSFCMVIHEPYQFSYTHEISDAQLEEIIEDEVEAWERAQDIAYSVIHSGPTPLFGNVLYYHSTSVQPSWDYSKIEESNTIGRHTFYTDRD